MTTKTDGGPAFPATVRTPLGDSGLVKTEQVSGMSLRDYFAAKAMAAMVASPVYVEGSWFQEDIAIQAYTMADAMLKEREKT